MVLRRPSHLVLTKSALVPTGWALQVLWAWPGSPWLCGRVLADATPLPCYVWSGTFPSSVLDFHPGVCMCMRKLSKSYTWPNTTNIRAIMDILGSVQGHVAWDSEQHGLVESVPGHDRRFGNR